MNAPAPLTIGTMSDSAELQQALERFAAGTATRGDVETLASAAERQCLRQVQVQVRRFKPPLRHIGAIRLLGKSGPYSNDDRSISKAGDHLYAAWFDVDALRLWLEQTEGRRG